MDIQEILNNFRLEGPAVSCRRHGNGHINDTYLAVTETGHQRHRYIIQRINHHIFKKPEELMENISGVTRYLRNRIAGQGGDPDRETLNLIPTTAGQPYYRHPSGDYWRCYDYIENTICYEQVEHPEDMYECGKAFGNFQHLLAGYPAESLHETIPGFHHTPLRFDALSAAAAADTCGRAALVKPELEFIRRRQTELSAALDLQKDGKLPLRVTHNDTKLNNILFDAKTNQGICVIDLDTIMPGLSLNDFGDTIRFGASTAAEDETDLEKVSLSLPLFEAYTSGFLEGTAGSLTPPETEMLPMGAKLMTIECGIRFLTDYLQGDVYFKTSRPGQNLDRTRTQLRLVEDMEEKWDVLTSIIKNAE